MQVLPRPETKKVRARTDNRRVTRIIRRVEMEKRNQTMTARRMIISKDCARMKCLWRLQIATGTTQSGKYIESRCGMLRKKKKGKMERLIGLGYIYWEENIGI